MSEFDLIVAYLQKHAGRVVEAIYYHEGVALSTVNYTLEVGKAEGYKMKEVFFFGNVQITSTVTGTVVLTNANFMNLKFMVDLKDHNENNYLDVPISVSLGMSLLGNSEYKGVRRLYGMGFNKLELEFTGWGAAVPTVKVMMNGYLFIMK